MTGDIPTRRQTVEFIQMERYLELRREDHDPYPTQTEPCWQTDIAFARKYAVMFGMVNNTEWDSWELFRDGRVFLRDVQAKCIDGTLSVAQCPLWSHRFKRLMSSSYEPSDLDLPRTPKGMRTLPDLKDAEKCIDLLLNYTTISEIAINMSKELNRYVSATKPSVTIAFWMLTHARRH